jgi:hypothetical protein
MKNWYVFRIRKFSSFIMHAFELYWLSTEVRNSMVNPLVSELNFWCSLQTPRFKLRDLMFSCKCLHTHTHTHKQKKRKPKQGCTIMAIIGWCICCIVQDVNPTACDTAYAVFGAKGLTSHCDMNINR